MRTVWWAAFAAAWCLAGFGCGGGEAPPSTSFERRDGGRDRDGGNRLPSSDGGDPPVGEAGTSEGGPQVEILAPAAADDPNSDTLITSRRLVVRCRVRPSAMPGASPVDADSVAIALLDADGTELQAPPVELEADATYEAELALEPLPNGPLQILCTAKNQASPPVAGRDEVRTFLDRGPRVQVLEPAEGSSHSGQMTVRFRVEPAPVSDQDSRASVTSVELRVAGIPIEDVTQNDEGVYAASIDFDDPLFGPPLKGESSLEVLATNSRTPDPVTRVHPVTFIVDDAGPTLEFLEPESGAPVGSVTTVRVEISDPEAGVDDQKVFGRIPRPGNSEGDFEFAFRAEDDGTYRGAFDTRFFSAELTELTINVTAADLAGNESTKSLNVKLDNQRPIASLDPPPVRMGKYNQDDELECSKAFDPLGDDTVNDAAIVADIVKIRARVEDTTNGGISSDPSVIFELAGVREDSVELYILDDTDVPLIEDTDEDGVCDEIHPDVDATSTAANRAVIIDFDPVEPAGRATYTSDAASDGYDFPAECTPGDSNTVPDRLCVETSSLRRVIPADLVDDNIPAIYAKPTIGDSRCVGDSIDLRANVQPGWLCAVIRVEDRLGNVGVSAPLRLCHQQDGEPACDGPPPPCTAECAPPAGFEADSAWQLIKLDN